MPKKKKKIVHIGMGKILCGISDEHSYHSVWSSTGRMDFYLRSLENNERLCHKCKYIFKHSTPAAK